MICSLCGTCYSFLRKYQDFPYSNFGYFEGQDQECPRLTAAHQRDSMSVLEFCSAPDDKFPAVQITTGKTASRSRMAIQPRTKILLVNDNADSRAALRSLLEKEPDMELIGEAEDGAASVRLAGVLKPDVVAMALGMFDREGMEIARQIIAASPDVKVLAVGLHSDSRLVVRMFHAGATGYMLKDHAFEELACTVRAVVANRTYLSPGLADPASED